MVKIKLTDWSFSYQWPNYLVQYGKMSVKSLKMMKKKEIEKVN